MSYADAVLSDKPIGYWRLNERAGTLAADSAGFHDGTYAGAPTLAQSGPLTGDGAAVRFHAPNDQITLGDVGLDLFLRPITVEAWVRHSAGGTEMPVFSTRGTAAGSADGLYFGCAGSGVLVFNQHAGADAFFTSNAHIDDGAWHHIVYTWDGVTGIIYVDGAPDNTKAQARAGVFSTGYCHIAWDPPNNEWLDGYAAEVAVYTHALTAERVAAHHSYPAVATGATLKLAEVIVDAAVAKLKAGMASRIAVINAEKNDGIACSAPDTTNGYFVGGVVEAVAAPFVIVTIGGAMYGQEGPHSFLYEPRLIVAVVDEDATRQNLTRKLWRQSRAIVECLWDDAPREALTGSAFTLTPVEEQPGPTERPDHDQSVLRSSRAVIFTAVQAEN